MSQNTSRLPTPLGWSDTDWLKRLQEWKERQEGEESPHPLAGLHINQGSYDAAADAYEAEYNAAHEDLSIRRKTFLERKRSENN